MAYSFGDGFDLYATYADAYAGYWDSAGGGATPTFVAGRFSNSQALQLQTGNSNTVLVKSSSVNDAVHHLVVAFRQTAAISGTTVGLNFQFVDNVTSQCCIVFRSDGAILLTSGNAIGTTLATYTGAVPLANTWYSFEFEVVINNTTGAFRVRRNGNTVNDFDSGATLNTRVSANNYANKLQLSMFSSVSAHQFDDLFWQSGAATGTWLGDIRCITRMPASDVSVHFTPLASAYPLIPFPPSAGTGVTAGRACYIPFTPSFSGSVGSIALLFTSASTGNFKCAIYSSVGGLPVTALGTATAVSAPGVGSAIFTFGTPVSVTAGTPYFAAFIGDTSSGQWSTTFSSTSSLFLNGVTYSTFPLNSPPVIITSTTNAICITVNITPATTANFAWVNEPQEDGLTTYVYDSTVNDADFYTIGSISSTPLSTVAVTTRGYMQKSDAGSRTAAVQLKSGTTTVASPTLTLTTSGFLWAWRTDLVDPNTSAAWTNSAVNAVNVGPLVVS